MTYFPPGGGALVIIIIIIIIMINVLARMFADKVSPLGAVMFVPCTSMCRITMHPCITMASGGASELERRPGEVGVEGERQESSGV